MSFFLFNSLITYLGVEFSFISVLSENKHKLHPLSATQYFFHVRFDANSSLPRELTSQFLIFNQPALRVVSETSSRLGELFCT